MCQQHKYVINRYIYIIYIYMYVYTYTHTHTHQFYTCRCTYFMSVWLLPDPICSNRIGVHYRTLRGLDTSISCWSQPFAHVQTPGGSPSAPKLGALEVGKSPSPEVRRIVSSYGKQYHKPTMTGDGLFIPPIKWWWLGMVPEAHLELRLERRSYPSPGGRCRS